MQDIHTIGGSASAIAGASLFLAGSGGGDRRLRPHSNQNNQLLKCPRCDSSNTKFCYYNNYNLSQPRHFCKNCRRYWTKGGVLRNVPVGGGCRKAKRSSKTTKQNTSSSLEAVVVAVKDGDSNSHSSSDSSSLTPTTTTTAALVANNAVNTASRHTAVTVDSSNSPTNLLSFPQSKLFMPQINQNQPLSMSHIVSSSGQIFPEAGSFTSLMTSPGESTLLGFNFGDVSAYNQMHQNENNGCVVEDHSSNNMMVTPGDEELKMEHTINYGYSEQTAHIGYSSLQQNRVTIGGLAGLNWQFDRDDGGEEETGLFDFTGCDDQSNYVVQNHWSDNDLSLNFPPLV